MEGGRIGNLVCRILLILSAAVVLGLSAQLTKYWADADLGCKFDPHPKRCRSQEGRWPASTDFSVFVGAWGLLDALVGVVAIFVTALPSIAVIGVDGLAAAFYLAGGVNLAVLYHQDFLIRAYVFNDKYRTRYQTDIAFMFIGLVFVLAAIVLQFISGRGGRYSSRSSV